MVVRTPPFAPNFKQSIGLDLNNLLSLSGFKSREYFTRCFIDQYGEQEATKEACLFTRIEGIKILMPETKHKVSTVVSVAGDVTPERFNQFMKRIRKIRGKLRLRKVVLTANHCLCISNEDTLHPRGYRTLLKHGKDCLGSPYKSDKFWLGKNDLREYHRYARKG